MRKSSVAIAFSVFIAAAPAPAAAQELDYYLPKATVAAGWQVRLVQCPTAANPNGETMTQAAVAGAYERGELVRLRSTSPFLASRSVALTFHENGLLKTINAEGEGKGGAVLTTLFKTAAGFIGLGPVGAGMAATTSFLAMPAAGGGGAGMPECTDKMSALLSEWEIKKGRIDSFEASVASGSALGATAQAIYEGTKTRVADIEKALTLTTSVKFEPALTSRSPEASGVPAGFDLVKGEYARYGFAKPVALAKWFKNGAVPDDLAAKPGQYGFCARFAIAKRDMDAASPVADLGVRQWRKTNVANDGLKLGRLNERFVYLRPLDMEIELRAADAIVGAAVKAAAESAKPAGPAAVDKAVAVTGTAACQAQWQDTKRDSEKLGGKTVTVPQLSGYFILPLGAGAFESKGSAAEFAVDGRIISLSHKGTGAGAGIGEALAGSLAAAETMRDAETKSIQRKIERAKAESDLDALLNPSPTSEVTEAE